MEQADIPRETENSAEISQNRQANERNKLDIIVPQVEMLMNLQLQMDGLVELKTKYQRMLYEPQLLFSYRRDCLALLTGFRLYNHILTTRNFSPESVRTFLEELQRQDKDLARQIENLLPKSDKRKLLFLGLVAAIWASKREGTDYLVNYIFNHMPELLAEANAVEDPKTSRELKRLFAVISGRELQSLEDDAKDCDNWVNIHYAAGSNMAVLKRRVELYFRGGYDGNTEFMGLLNDFGERELAKGALSNEKIRNLSRYEEQVAYTESLIDMCRKSETPEGREEWTGFFGKDGFWGTEEDEKGKNFDRHANEFLTKYGNKDFRDTLMAYKFRTNANPNGIGQSPEGWGGVWQGNQLVKPGFLHILLRRLQHPTYQRKMIIVPAAEELKKLFGKQAAELRGQRDKSIKELVAIINRIKGAAINYKIILAKLRALLVRKKRIMLNDILKDSDELTREMKTPMEEYNTFTRQMDSDPTLNKIDFRSMVRAASKWKEAAEKRANFVVRAVNSDYIGRNLQSLTKAMAANEFVKNSLIQIDTLLSFGHVTDDDLSRIQQWLYSSQEVIRKLNLLYDYIKSKLPARFGINIEEFEKLDLNSIKIRNPEFNFRTLRKDVNHLAAINGLAQFTGLGFLRRA